MPDKPYKWNRAKSTRPATRLIGPMKARRAVPEMTYYSDGFAVQMDQHVSTVLFGK